MPGFTNERAVPCFSVSCPVSTGDILMWMCEVRPNTDITEAVYDCYTWEIALNNRLDEAFDNVSALKGREEEWGT